MKLRGNRCQCSACGEYFNSVAAFDKHRRGKAERICLTAEQMAEAGMGKNKSGYWVGSFRSEVVENA